MSDKYPTDEELKALAKQLRAEGKPDLAFAPWEVVRLRKILRNLRKAAKYPEDRPTFPHFVAKHVAGLAEKAWKYDELTN